MQGFSQENRKRRAAGNNFSYYTQREAINKIEKIRNLRIVPLTNEIAASAKEYVKSTYLMSIDSVHVATMKAHGIKNIATNDSDFERVDFLKVWKP